MAILIYTFLAGIGFFILGTVYQTLQLIRHLVSENRASSEFADSVLPPVTFGEIFAALFAVNLILALIGIACELIAEHMVSVGPILGLLIIPTSLLIWSFAARVRNERRFRIELGRDPSSFIKKYGQPATVVPTRLTVLFPTLHFALDPNGRKIGSVTRSTPRTERGQLLTFKSERKSASILGFISDQDLSRLANS